MGTDPQLELQRSAAVHKRCDVETMLVRLPHHQAPKNLDAPTGAGLTIDVRARPTAPADYAIPS